MIRRIRLLPPCRAAVLLGLGWTLALPAQENTRAPAAAPSIEDARRELDALRAARDAKLAPAETLPRVELPPLPAPGSGQASPVKKAPDPSAKQKSPNWLLEAMLEPNDDAREKKQPRPRDRSGWRIDEDEAGTRDRAARRGQEESREGEKPDSIVINPLARYLGEWMTPQDYALLKPGLESMTAPAGGASPPPITPVTPAASILGLNELILGGSPVSTPRAVPEVPRENPYLQSPTPAPVVSIPAPAKPSVVAPPRPAPVISAPPPPAPPAPTRVPDFIRSPNDEKYFKQLNRF